MESATALKSAADKFFIVCMPVQTLTQSNTWSFNVVLVFRLLVRASTLNADTKLINKHERKGEKINVTPMPTFNHLKTSSYNI